MNRTRREIITMMDIATEPNLNHYIRQMGLIDPTQLSKRILVVGAGSIGSWTTLALLKLGCYKVAVLDFDVVEEHNAGSQVYTSLDEGKTKLDALEFRLTGLTELKPLYIDNQLEEDNAKELLEPFDIVIGAIDNIEGRKLMFDSLKGTNKLYIDGRMAGNAIEIYTIPMNDPEKVKLYESTLFSNDEAIHIPCSERSVVYNCFVVAGLIADIVAQASNGDTLPAELIVDLRNLTMFT